MPASSADAATLVDEIDGLTVVREPSLSSVALAFRVDRPPFVDIRVRRAIDLLLDRSALIEAAGYLAGEAVPVGVINPNLADGFWSPVDGEGAAESTPVADTTAEARSLLDAAGATALSFDLQVAQVPQLLDVASSIVAQLAAEGLAVTLRPMPILTWFQNSRRGDFTATLIQHAPYETPDGAMRWYHVNGPDGNGNPMGFNDAEISSAIERSWGERDRSARRELLLDAQQAAIDQHAMLHLFAGSGFTCVRDYVRDSGLDLPGSLSRYHYRQWLALPVEGRPD
jgi:peptide/nickel transport system substrate-binding protein